MFNYRILVSYQYDEIHYITIVILILRRHMYSGCSMYDDDDDDEYLFKYLNKS